MDLLHIIVLALIQGISEFLPISSSGHLILPSQLLGWPDQGLAFDVAVHVGSLAAVVFYFRNDIVQLLAGWGNSLAGKGHSQESAMVWFIILGTVPAGLAGLLFDDFIEANLRSIVVIAATTVIWGIALGWADKAGRRKYELTDFTWKTALLIGLSQALALIPGTSRSGITMTAALALGYTRQAAARFSFLLSIPIILLSGGYKALQLLDLESVPWFDIVLGTVLSGISAYICIFAFLKVIEKMGMMPFVIYRLLLGGFLFGIWYWGWV